MDYPHYDYAVLGGDMRQVWLAEELAHHQNRICHYGLPSLPNETHCSDASVVHAAGSLKEACLHSKCIACPIPFIKKDSGLMPSDPKHPFSSSAILELLHSGQTLFGGQIPEDFRKAAADRGVTVFDYLDDESLAVRNSIAAAEGAICEAITRSPYNLHKSSCAVLGFGRCGQTLVSYLKGMFCNVTVCTNDPKESARASIISDGCIPLKKLPDCAGNFDFIFNTIPARVLTSDILRRMKHTVLIIDIASAPGGVDFAAADRLGITAAHCLSLPGKYAPAASAHILREIIDSSFSPKNNMQ